MNFAFYGFNKYSYGFAKLLCDISKNTDRMQVSGIFAKSTDATVNAAINTNTKAYTSLDDLLKEADVIIIGFLESSLSEVSLVLKEKGIKNKILCHFSPKYDSSVLSCGITNTCYNILFPYNLETSKIPVLSEMPILFEGGGRRHEEFEDIVKEVLPSCKFVTRQTRRLSLIANRFVAVHSRLMLILAQKLFKIAGTYDDDGFANLAFSSVKISMCAKTQIPQSIKINEDELRKNLRTINSLNDPEIKEYYKNLELHAMEDVPYPQEQKYIRRRILGKKR